MSQKLLCECQVRLFLQPRGLGPLSTARPFSIPLHHRQLHEPCGSFRGHLVRSICLIIAEEVSPPPLYHQVIMGTNEY